MTLHKLPFSESVHRISETLSANILEYLDEKNIKKLDQIIADRDLKPIFSAIVNIWEEEVCGYEGLTTGPDDSPLFNPQMLYLTALRLRRCADLQLAAAEVMIKQFTHRSLPGRLIIPVPITVLQDPGFTVDAVKDLLKTHKLESNRILLQLSECPLLQFSHTIIPTLDTFRQKGIHFSIDHFGSCSGAIKPLTLLQPKLVILDRSLTEGIRGDLHHQSFIRTVIDASRSNDAQVVASGVEEEEEYNTLESLGIHLMSGPLMGKAANKPKTVPSKKVTKIRGERYEVNQLPKNTAASLLDEVPAVSPDATVEVVGDIFQTIPRLQTLPVVDGGCAVGVIRRVGFMDLFLYRYGRDLYGKKPISFFMEHNPITIEIDLPLEQVSQNLTSQMELNTQQDFLIVRNGKYVGIGHIVDLLRVITARQIQNARYANPLTGLPGNIPINDLLNEYLALNHEFVVVYVDLDNFKPFNDVYGYAMGDEVIKGTASLLSTHCNPESDFVGHVGGDDFVLVMISDDWE
ncbi:MAG: EAL domain-containing protein, partial [Gammaproteobacteria bacterium]|nr:EAL domain-containing protein [Gammaproteobacteria bacterium]